jgi:long-chain acyl-CoA synthetase
MLSLEEVDGAGDPAFALSSIWPVPDQQDVVTLIYTSGTTGPPKGVQLTHAGVIANARALHEAIPAYRAGFSAVSYLPLAHASARVLEHYYGLLLGATLTCCPDLKDLSSALVETRPTWLFGPPRMWEKLQASVTATITVEPDDQRRQAIEAAIETGLRLVRARQTGEQPPAALLADYERRCSVSALTRQRCVRDEVATAVARANTQLSLPEQIQRWTLLDRDWLPGGVELTPTMKLQRRPISTEYAGDIEALYR